MLGFRVWDKEKKIFAVWKDFYINEDGVLFRMDDDLGFDECWNHELLRYIPMQSTGIKDINNIMIYQGDIVLQAGHHANGRDYVFYNEPFIVDEIVNFYAEYFGPYKNMPLKVIGNVYASPEAMENWNARV